MGRDVDQAGTQKALTASSSEPSTSDEKMGIEVTGILLQFWRDADDPDEVRAVEMRGWLDVMAGCSVKEIRAAWADYQKTGPRSGRGALYRPDAGAIWTRIEKARKDQAIIHPKPRVMIEERREPASAEARARILKEVYADRTDGEVAYAPRKMP